MRRGNEKLKKKGGEKIERARSVTCGPTIQGRTFGSDNPQLKPPTAGDIIDYYGPCDHNPLGKEEIESQTRVWEDRRLQD